MLTRVKRNRYKEFVIKKFLSNAPHRLLSTQPPCCARQPSDVTRSWLDRSSAAWLGRRRDFKSEEDKRTPAKIFCLPCKQIIMFVKADSGIEQVNNYQY